MSTINFDKIQLIVNEATPDTIQSWIDRCIRLLNVLDVQVETNHLFEYDFVGQCVYTEGKIRIGKLEPDQALLALIHEAGHWVSHLRLNHGGLLGTTYEREMWAFFYGWWVIRKIGLDTLIDKTMWKAYQAVEIKAYAEYKKRQGNQNGENSI